jgi:cytoplasmic iron level regulating protein YaaA (DUF328/UPF0246 family)
MFLVISPAKKLTSERQHNIDNCTSIMFPEHCTKLVNILKKYSSQDLMQLMKLSQNLAELNARRFQQIKLPFTKSTAHPAILCFNGDVYEGLDASSLTKQQLQNSQDKLGILSGLYGLLKPLDLIMPYRLEMGSKLQIGKLKNLYEFWGDTITETINKQLNQAKHKVLINLASNEYFKAINLKKLNHKIVTPIFKDWKQDNYKIISFYAKKARGMMCRFVLDNQITDPKDLKNFNSSSYKYSPKLSTEQQLVFLRKQTS